MTQQAPELICITGTTGSGKNHLGVLVAERLGAEIISLDSMKVYRGMDIGTAKPGAHERARVRHHLIDILDPRDHMDLRQFLARAEVAVTEIRGRGQRVVCVGGTAMYLAGLLYGVMDGPSRDADFRAALRRERDESGTEALHRRLQDVDPDSAARIMPADYQRIERALEIHALTGRPATAFRQDWFQGPARPATLYVLTWPRDELRRRIFARVDQMFDSGWLDEVRALIAAGGLG
ncbi:MAG: tRNA (adenosine(37)-N6)-dimethylallyltransferase MiaA, partial [Planctomycetes bacterium]|nr:tRNA (adenosine(37)-N6)-dimethylallyltransferase MiaA [Planctomycetota bacterium]